jgi:hypothetical protein
MLMALIDLIDDEANVGALAAGVRAASTPEAALAAEIRLTRVFQERCGDLIGALFAAAAVEPDLAAAVAEGQRRHRDGARLAMARITELGGLRADLAPERAAALIAIATTYEAWHELRNAYRLSWDAAEALLHDTLSRAMLSSSPPRPAGNPGGKTRSSHRAPSTGQPPQPRAGCSSCWRLCLGGALGAQSPAVAGGVPTVRGSQSSRENMAKNRLGHPATGWPSARGTVVRP